MTRKAQHDTKFCKAAFWARLRGELHPFFPLRSVVTGLSILVALLAILAVAELILRSREAHDTEIAGPWEMENAIINANNGSKIIHERKLPIWSSTMFPYTGERRTSKRILALGDSFVWGDGYANINDTWWRQLQWELNRRGYWDVQVVGVGTGGAGTQGQLEWMRDQKLLEKTDPDMVLVGYVTNDAQMREASLKQLSGEMLASEERLLRSAFLDRILKPVLPRVTEDLQKKIVEKRFSRRPVTPDSAFPYWVWELKILDGHCLEAYTQLVEELGQYRKTMPCPLIFVTVPNFPDWKRYDIRFSRVRPLFKRAGIPFYETLRAFVAKEGSPRDVSPWKINPANSHPGIRSTAFAATQMADILERDYSECLGALAPPLQSAAAVV